jgi:excisionase family DNA binding protein
MSDTDLISIKDAAAYLQVSERTIRRWIADGKLNPVPTPGAIVRLRRADLTPEVAAS